MSIRQCVRPNGSVLIRFAENTMSPVLFRWGGMPPIGVVIWERDGQPEFVDFGDGTCGTWEVVKGDPRLSEYERRRDPPS